MSAAAPALQCISLRDVESHWREKVRAAQHVALFLDFDGTISPIAMRPEDAEIDPAIRHTLQRLRDLENVDVAVISGRRLSDVKERTGVDGIIYAGNHGLEIETRDLCFRELTAECLRLELRRLVLRLEQLFADITGVEIESKGLSAAVHYRQAHESVHDWVRSTVFDALSPSQTFVAMQGKMVVDIRPKVAWDKGSAVRWILERLPGRHPFTVVMGDDLTDEDAFRVAGYDALTIRVGEPMQTSARFWIPDVSAAREFLATLYELRYERKKR